MFPIKNFGINFILLAPKLLHNYEKLELQLNNTQWLSKHFFIMLLYHSLDDNGIILSHWIRLYIWIILCICQSQQSDNSINCFDLWNVYTGHADPYEHIQSQQYPMRQILLLFPVYSEKIYAMYNLHVVNHLRTEQGQLGLRILLSIVPHCLYALKQ